MALLGFRPRSESRDRATDDDRHRRLLGLLEELAAECGEEERGLEKRYAASRDSAGAVLQALDAEEDDRRLEARLGAFEASLTYCERRVRHLRRLRDFYAGLRAKVEAEIASDGETASAD